MRGKYLKRIIGLVCLCLVYCVCPKPASAEIVEEMAADNWKGKVDWEQGYVYATAIGTANMDEMVNEIHAEQVARKTATHLAYLALYEVVGKVRIDATSIYRKQLMQDDILKVETKGELENVHVWKEEFSWTTAGSPMAVVTVRIALNGGLSRSAAGWAARQQKTPRFTEEIHTAKVDYTGLIVDASGTNVRPCLCPKILTNNGAKEVYGPSGADFDTVSSIGFVAYARSIEDAKKVERIGQNPLIIGSTGGYGPRKGDVIIAEHDAITVLAADITNNILKECRVVIVVN